jgi:glycosyltransferase involved in cell wall biosynthesis
MTTLTVVIPAYNEENCIAQIMQRVLNIREKLSDVNVNDLELLVVDDGSKDKTARIAREIASCNDKVWIISHAANRGYGAALKTGFSKASGELIGFLDADGTYPPEYFPELCELSLNGWELVIGSRMAGEDTKMPFVRKLGNRFFAWMISLLGQYRITDSASGMRVFHKDILPRIYPLPDGLNLTPIMSTRAIHENLRMIETPIPYEERVGASKLSAVRDGSVYLQSITWTVICYNPVRVFGIFGLAGVVLAGLIGLGLVIARLSGITTLPPWSIAALYTALVSGVAGISIFALGATFNYLVSLFYKRPIRQGLFGKPILKTPLESHFGWSGIAIFAVGVLIALISFLLGLNGWEIERLWLYLLGSALFILVGIQLVIYWLLIRVLDELSQRDTITQEELLGA